MVLGEFRHSFMSRAVVPDDLIPYEKNADVSCHSTFFPSGRLRYPTHVRCEWSVAREPSGHWPRYSISSLAESTTMALSRSSRTQSIPLPATMELAVPFITFHR